MWLPVRSILYVCTGNVFRSPVAEQITRRLLCDSDVKVESAGILDYNGEPLPPEIIELAMRYGVNLALHKPRRVNADLIDAADLILVFDKKQVGELVGEFPNAKGKTQTIKNYAGWSDDKDMEDLWGKPPEAFERSLGEINGLIERCVSRMKKMEGLSSQPSGKK
jgi:protein-tyrosine phosphatase